MKKSVYDLIIRVMSKETIDKSRFCLILGEWCYKECPHYYYRDFNGCCRKPRIGTKGGENAK